MERKVKGSLVIDYVKMIRRSKDVDWKKHLLPEDLSFLSQRIQANEWYPIESFERIGLAVLAEIGKGNVMASRLRGRGLVDALVKENRELVCAMNPRESLIRLQVVRTGLFNFEATTVLVFFRNYVKLELSYHLSPQGEEAVCLETLGLLERLLQLSGATNIQSAFTRKSWEGAPSTILELDWSEIAPEKKVKGALINDYLVTPEIRERMKNTRFLTAEDKALLQGQVSPEEWYPLSTFERIVLATFLEAADKDLEAVRDWGRAAIDNIYSRMKTIIAAGAPHESMARFQGLRKVYYTFEPIDIQTITDKSAKMKIDYGMSRQAERVVTYRILGYFERLLELSGARNVKTRLAGKVWEGDPATILEFSWSKATSERKVRGRLFVDYIRMVKSKKDADWKKYLLAEDKVFLKEPIQPDEWYPLATFERMGNGIVTEVAQGNMAAVRLWGRLTVDPLVKSEPALVSANDPMETLMKFQVMRKVFFNFDAIEIEALYSQYAKIKINYEMGPLACEAATNQALGFFERLLELSGAKEIKYKFLSQAWSGDPVTILEMRWLL